MKLIEQIPDWIKAEAERWETELDERRIDLCRTYPLSNRNLEYRSYFQILQEQIEILNNQLMESQQRNNVYQNQISELEEQVAKLRREQRRVAGHFCLII